MMSNREAIALLRNLEYALDSYCELNEEGKTAFRMAIESLELFGNSEHLPSAQLEIIRCKDCKHWTNNIGDYKLRDNYCNEEAHGNYYQCSEDDYCSFADAEMRGEQDDSN